MDYKDLLQRYKKGLLNDEEKRIIEEEIEKHEAIEEFLTETMDEDNYDSLDTMDLENHKEETSKLKKSVNKKLRKVVLTSVLIVVVLYIGIFYVLSDIVDKIYYDPTATTQSEESKYKKSDFYYDMQAYVSLNMPGFSIYSTFQEPKGFGEYEVIYSLKDLFSESEKMYLANFSRNKLTFAIDGIFNIKNRFEIWEGFETVTYQYQNNAENDATLINKLVQENNEKTLQYLNELNPLSYISMSIVFDDDLTMEQFYYLKQEHPSLDFKWVGIRTAEVGTKWNENQPMFLIGFNPNNNDEPSSSTRPDPEKYPLFYLEDARDYPELANKEYPERTIESYSIHFKSRLEYIRNREGFIDMFDYNHYKIDYYDYALKYVEEQGVKTYGVLVFGTAKDFLESIQDIPYESLYINDVLPTKPNIYYK